MKISKVRGAVGIAAVAAAVTFGAASADGAQAPREGKAGEPCSTWQGATVDADAWRKGCTRSGETFRGGWTDCVDGRILWWSGWGWGFEDDVARAHVAATMYRGGFLRQPQDMPPNNVYEPCMGID